MKHIPRHLLESGVDILDSLLVPLGFEFSFEREGYASGGRFAHGKYVCPGENFVQGELAGHARILGLHHRWGLGIVNYQISNLQLSHDYYLKFLNVEKQSRFPWTPLDSGLERYRTLRDDLKNFGTDFLIGSADTWTIAAREMAEKRAIETREYRAKYSGDDSKRQKARELFREKRYNEVVMLLSSVSDPDLLPPSERQMLQIAKNRQDSR